jgi:4'-phosphopantetheinyl transferase
VTDGVTADERGLSSDPAWPAWPMTQWPVFADPSHPRVFEGAESPSGEPTSTLDPAGIHLLRLWLPDWFDCSQAAVYVLSEDERYRAARFVSAAIRLRFVACRFALRCCLAQLLACPPGEIRFGYGAQGKPYVLAPSPTRLSFNVSHSHDLAVIALGWGCELGVDVERIEGRETWRVIAGRLLSPSEQLQLDHLPTELQSLAFYRIWTCKEAYLKGTGQGMTIPLRRFAVCADPRQPPRLLEVLDQPEETGRWHLHAVQPWAGFVAAAIWEGFEAPVHCWTCHPPTRPIDCDR